MKSVFDGWTKQVKGRYSDGGGGFCARGYILQTSIDHWMHYRPEEIRIGRWIQANLNPPQSCALPNAPGPVFPASDPISAIVWANDTGALDIEGFKMADLLSQGYVPEETVAEEEVKAEEESAICK
jgi:hypothetical protein